MTAAARKAAARTPRGQRGPGLDKDNNGARIVPSSTRGTSTETRRRVRGWVQLELPLVFHS